MKKNLEYIKKILKKNENILREKFKVKNLGIFGSFVRGEQNKNSDLDILVEFYETIDLFTFIELKQFLSNILHTEVDLVMKETLKKRFKNTIEKETLYI
ncbi:MAG TPA: nucleotidyltransferase family protein [Caldisericia bacterium]|mgnify:FL=1|nr:nucleotidyltransferase family protein [bacterium]HQJ56745.1 nucleotidyltransferase family protein [Caldisericia bacterium]